MGRMYFVMATWRIDVVKLVNMLKATLLGGTMRYFSKFIVRDRGRSSILQLCVMVVR